MPAILVPEAEVAYQILALNTEKAHNLKEKSLEVIRMYRALAAGAAAHRRGGLGVPVRVAAPRITLGLLYEENKRFAGGAFAPILKRVDKFLNGRLPRTLDGARRTGGKGARGRRGARRGRSRRSRSAASTTRT